METLGNILKTKVPPQPVQSRVTKSWQDKAFRDMEYIGVKLKPKDISRVFRIYKEESEGKKYKAQTSRVISYLKDYPTPLDYDGKLKMFFKLITNGFEGFKYQ